MGSGRMMRDRRVELQLAFIRQGSHGLENLIVVKFMCEDWLRNREIVPQGDIARTRKELLLGKLDVALSDWMDETKEGAIAWDRSSKDFNIGDLVNVDMASLRPYLAKYGIYETEIIYSFSSMNDWDVNFDRVLVTR